MSQRQRRRVQLTFLDLSDDPVHGCGCPLGLPALLVRSVLLLLLAGAGGQVRAVLPGAATSSSSSATSTTSLVATAAAAHRLATTAAGHLQALGTDRPPVARIATAAGVWIRVVSLPAWPGYLGDDAGLIAPRRESGKPVGRDEGGEGEPGRDGTQTRFIQQENAEQPEGFVWRRRVSRSKRLVVTTAVLVSWLAGK